jgi:hypothetical protein
VERAHVDCTIRPRTLDETIEAKIFAGTQPVFGGSSIAGTMLSKKTQAKALVVGRALR